MSKGAHKLEHEVLQGWERMPEGWSFVEVAGVATDSRDRVYVFCRGEHPVIVFDREGKFLNAWGEGVFTTPHGIFIDRNDRNLLHDVITVIDNALTRPWTVDKRYVRSADLHAQWPEFICNEYNGQVMIGSENYYLSGDGLLMPARRDQAPPDLRYFKQRQK